MAIENSYVFRNFKLKNIPYFDETAYNRLKVKMVAIKFYCKYPRNCLHPTQMFPSFELLTLANLNEVDTYG